MSVRMEPTQPDLQNLLTVEDVATLLSVPRSWVYEHTRSRDKSQRIPHVKLGKYVRFDLSAVRAWLERKAA